MILVPAILRLMGERAWWTPGAGRRERRAAQALVAAQAGHHVA